ncbi:hypothetical protein B5G28_08455 [Faecalibacterium sp. An77]|uniref:glycosyltransferase family 2 protein n=1 Tax=Faecalibacterium sp. An77 TaxID=1965655 RepID=UPI000B370201|nr:glycosyltransferase family 2 protein [Faecalibacterium sp. An77]OUN38712.1 hypothetical protein B5G28_08455 [Faecalibacterium sp. An77]
MYQYKFTVFTPVFNRGTILSRCFNALQQQTLKDFEWVIVNDGSTDNSDEVIKDIIEQTDIPITYLRLEHNSGKHVAQNRAVDIAKGELFVPLDSDDYIIPEALEIFWNAWVSISENERIDYSGVGVHCMDQQGDMIGTPYPKDRMVSNDLEMHFKFRVDGEKWGVIRTDIMQKFKNVEVKGHFLSESTVWFRIAKKYPKKLFLQKCLRIYEVHEDSVTKQMKSHDYNIDSRIVSDCIYLNGFYNWYLHYRLKTAIRKPLALTYNCIVNDKAILLGKDALIKKVDPLVCKVLIAIASIYKLVWTIKKR